MIKAILLDLNGTLLSGTDDVLSETFLQTLARAFSQQHGHDGLLQVLRHGMSTPQHVRTGEHTNEQVLIHQLAAQVGRPIEAVTKQHEALMTESLDYLRDCTSPVPGARDLIDMLQADDYTVVIVTDPIYPLSVVRQRLDWAGLGDDKTQYAFVAASDTTHFPKSDPAFYAEILGRIGTEPDEAIMVGDSARHDLAPAEYVGIHTFHITDATDSLADDFGSLAIFRLAMNDDKWLGSKVGKPLHADMIEPQYRGHIGALMGVLQDMPDHAWHQHPIPGEWSPIQVVCHLADSEEMVQRPRLQHIADNDNPFLADPKPPPRADQFPCYESGMEVAQRFAASRWETIHFLRQLAPEDWQRPARHSIFGPTTLLEMTQFTARHDRLHLEQLCQTVGRCT